MGIWFLCCYYVPLLPSLPCGRRLPFGSTFTLCLRAISCLYCTGYHGKRAAIQFVLPDLFRIYPGFHSASIFNGIFYPLTYPPPKSLCVNIIYPTFPNPMSVAAQGLRCRQYVFLHWKEPVAWLPFRVPGP